MALARARVQVGRAGSGPVLSYPAVQQPRRALLAHVLVGRIEAKEVTERADLRDVLHRQRLVVDRDAAHRELDHARELVVHDELAVVEGDARLEHPQAVDQVGACQRWQKGRKGLLVPGLGTPTLASAYAPATQLGSR